MNDKLTQENRFIAVDTPLGKDKLVLTSYQGLDEMSRPFSYKLEMVSQEDSLDANKLIGKAVTFKVAMPDDRFRYYNGHVRRFAAGQHSGYEEDIRHFWAEVVPWFKLLDLNANCRIFQDKKVPEIVEQVFKDAGYTDYQMKTRGTYPKLEFCVQYNESDYQFTSRLMEEAGLYYYFKHEDKKHTMVVGDHAGGYVDCDQSEVSYFDGEAEADHLHKWEHCYELTTGKYASADYNFETPTTQLLSKEKTIVKAAASKEFEVFEYPGGFADKGAGKQRATAGMERLEVAHDTVVGAGYCASFTPGGKFKLKEHPDKSEKGAKYSLVSVEHKAWEPSLEYRTSSEDKSRPVYENSFVCIPAAVTYRPPRTTTRTVIHGPQTAKVVGPKGNEIYTDKHGRVKVQFHWDREGKFDEKSSCWMRVSQEWAGKGWGSVFLPRVGDEVIVDFLNGDPDRPIVTGRVYNGENKTPYKLPDEHTTSGIKTRSSDKGTDKQFNELRFDDKIDKEHIYFHAQKDFARVVEHIDTLQVGFDKLKGNLPLAGGKGDQLVEILNNQTVTIHEGDCTLQVAKKDHLIKVDKGSQIVTIKTDQKIKIDKAHKMEVGTESLTKANKSIKFVVGGNSITIDQQGIKIQGMQVAVKGDIGVKVEGGATVDVKGGAMVKLKGGMVMIN